MEKASWVVPNCKNTNRYLIANRSDGSGWCFFGGKVEPNESHVSAACREAYEEARFDIEPDKLIWMLKSVAKVGEDNSPVHAQYYKMVTENELKPVLNKEHNAFKWVNVENFPSNFHEAALPAVEKIKQEQLNLERSTSVPDDADFIERRDAANRKPEKPIPDAEIKPVRPTKSGDRKSIVFSTRSKMNGSITKLEMRVEGELVASVMIGKFNAKMYDLRVEKGHRGKGYAHALMSHLMTLPIAPLCLKVKAANDGNLSDIQLVDFYSKFGFKPVSSIKDRIEMVLSSDD